MKHQTMVPLSTTIPYNSSEYLPMLHFSFLKSLTRTTTAWKHNAGSAARPLQASQAANISLCGAILRANRVDVGPARRSHSLLLLVFRMEQSIFDQSEQSKKCQHFVGKFLSS